MIDAETAKIRLKTTHLIQQYRGTTCAIDEECDRLEEELRHQKIPLHNEEELSAEEDAFHALVFIEGNTTPMYLREASMMICGDSKYFGGEKDDRHIMNRVCTILRNYQGMPLKDDEYIDEVLELYNIYPNLQTLGIKGNVILQYRNGSQTDVSQYPNGYFFSSEDLGNIALVQLHSHTFMTVENNVSWERLNNAGNIYFLLSGYCTRVQRDFIRMVYRDNPEVSYLHFGDIDAGGLYIYKHLKKMTGVPFEMYKMSEKELNNPEFQSCLHHLTMNDRTRLQALINERDIPECYLLAEYLLDHDVKMEQEIVSYYEMKAT